MHKGGIVEYDMVVLGAGIAGTTTALCLSQAGVKTLVVEKKIHPRFAIGESTIPLTTLDFKKLGIEWNIPELQNISSYLGMRSLSLTTYPKEIFWFGYSKDGEPVKLEDETITVTTFPPLGPDSHMLRADVDRYLSSLFPKYSVDYTENTAVTEFITGPDADFVEMDLHSYSETPSDWKVRCKFVVDCTGHNCFLSRRYGLHHHDAHLVHHSRTIYSHFMKPPGWDLDAVLGGRNPYMHTKRSNGTVHHMFEGGWIWVIPFENDTVSVGIVLDLQMYPLDHSISASDEWNSIIARFPTVQAHLGSLKPMRPLLRTGRIQITSETILGDRFILAPHAASFIDPLYSTGMALTLRFVRRFLKMAKEIISVERSPTIHNPTAYIKQILQPMELSFKQEVGVIDKLVAGSFDSTHHSAIYWQYWRFWINSGIISMGTKDKGTAPLYCADDPKFVAALDEGYNLVHNFAQKVRSENVGISNKQMVVDETEALEVAARIKELVDQHMAVFHKKVLFPILPHLPLIPTEPNIIHPNIFSEYQFDFLYGFNRPRILSLLLVFYEMALVKGCYLLGKVLGPRFQYGSDLVKLFKSHVVPKNLKTRSFISKIKAWLGVGKEKSN